jgi:hypothetical protein
MLGQEWEYARNKRMSSFMLKTLLNASTTERTGKIDPRILLLVLGTDAFIVAGVLPEIAHETMVSESLAGQ